MTYFRQLMQARAPVIDSALGHLAGAEFLPRPVAGAIPLMVTGSSRQSLAWIGEHADGWLTFPQTLPEHHHVAVGHQAPGRVWR